VGAFTHPTQNRTLGIRAGRGFRVSRIASYFAALGIRSVLRLVSILTEYDVGQWSMASQRQYPKLFGIVSTRKMLSLCGLHNVLMLFTALNKNNCLARAFGVD